MGTELWRWIQKQDIGPQPRAGFSMAYDSASKKTILFGGADVIEYKNDTWEWDGNEWIQVADTGPSKRGFHSMTYDSSEKEMLLFGGCDYSASPVVYFGDTWKMKDNVWVKVQDIVEALTLNFFIFTYGNLRISSTLVFWFFMIHQSDSQVVSVSMQRYCPEISFGGFEFPIMLSDNTLMF